jgi:nitrate/nitrite transport system permease protein
VSTPVADLRSDLAAGPHVVDLDAADAPTAAPSPTPRVPAIGARTKELVVSTLFRLLGLACFVGVWWAISRRAPDLPDPPDVWTSLTGLLGDAFASSDANGKGIGLQLLDSLGRTAKGFGLAALVGIPFGLAIGTSRRAWQAANPVIQLLRPVSPLAWFPLGLVTLKSSPDAAVFAIFVTALWPVVVNTAAGAASVPADQRNVARVFRFRRCAYARQILVPHTMPSIVTGLRLSKGTAWMVIVAAEMLSGNTGIGFFVWNSYNGGNLAAVISAIVVIGAVGVSLDCAFTALGRRYSVEGTR